MLTLSILRHAKSGWDDPDLEDIDRPLAARGRKTAPLVGAFMAEHEIAPDIVLCSPSKRTRETLELVREQIGNPKATFPKALYLATEETLLAQVNAIKGPTRGKPRHALIVGHNPGLQDFVLALMEQALSNAGERRAISTKLPTAALVVLDFEAERWRDVAPGTGRLRHFVTPKRLQAA